MPKIIVNEIEKKFDTSSVSNMNELYEKLMVEFKTQGSFVTEIFLNGERLSEEDLQNKGDVPIKDIDKLELVIRTLQEITLNNINNAMDYLDKLIPGVNKASELFRTKNAEEANKFYVGCIDGLAWLQEVIDNVKIVLREELEKLDLGSSSIEDYQKQLLSLTKEINDTQSKKDWVMLADLLEYELSPYLEEWKSIFPLFVRAANNKIKTQK